MMPECEKIKHAISYLENSIMYCSWLTTKEKTDYLKELDRYQGKILFMIGEIEDLGIARRGK